MADLPQAYSRVLRVATGYWGTYLPSLRLEPGMLFEIDGGVMTRAGHLIDKAAVDPALLAVDEQTSDDAVSQWATHAVTMEVVGADVAAPAGAAHGRVRLRFGQANEAAVICNGMRSISYADITGIKDVLRALQRSGVWNMGWSLVTDVVVVDSAWLCFSTERDQAAEIAASAPIALPAAPLEALAFIAGHGTLSAGVSAAKTSAVCVSLPAGGTPLFRSIRFNPSWLGLGTPQLDYVKGGSEEFLEPDLG